MKSFAFDARQAELIEGTGCAVAFFVGSKAHFPVHKKESRECLDRKSSIKKSNAGEPINPYISAT
jgi:hypothetical protein